MSESEVIAQAQYSDPYYCDLIIPKHSEPMKCLFLFFMYMYNLVYLTQVCKDCI